jgi:hypothetical protein
MQSRVLALFLVVLGALALGAVARAPVRPAAAVAPEPGPDELGLARALVEAEANGEAARDLEAATRGEARVHLDARELEAAFGANRLVAARLDPDVRGRAVLAVRVVRSCAAAFEVDEGRESLEAERLTAEDLRFLLGALHAALEGVRGGAREHAGGKEGYRAGALRQFRGMSFDDALRGFE